MVIPVPAVITEPSAANISVASPPNFINELAVMLFETTSCSIVTSPIKDNSYPLVSITLLPSNTPLACKTSSKVGVAITIRLRISPIV